MSKNMQMWIDLTFASGENVAAVAVKVIFLAWNLYQYLICFDL